MNNIKTYITFTIIFICACSCTEELIHKKGLPGTLTGYVYAYDPVEGTSLLANSMITIEGTDPLVVQYTDIKGKFSVPDLETGTYHIHFSKPGYGTYKTLGYSFVGGDVPAVVTATLYALPEIQIKDVDAIIAKSWDNHYLNCAIFTDDPETSSNYGYFRYYLSKEPDVSIIKYQETGILGPYYQGSINQYSKILNKTKFISGSDVYLVIYPATETFSNYLDIETGNKIYTSVGEYSSGVIKLKVPE